MVSNPDAAKKSFCSQVNFVSHSSYLKSSWWFSDFLPTTSHSFPADNLIFHFTEKIGGAGYHLPLLPDFTPTDYLQSFLSFKNLRSTAKKNALFFLWCLRSDSFSLPLPHWLSPLSLAFPSFPSLDLSLSLHGLLSCIHLWTQPHLSLPFTIKLGENVVCAIWSLPPTLL